jgi:Lipase maturation factor
MDTLLTQDVIFVRSIFEKSLGAIYFTAFLSAFNQFPTLLGEKGLLPVPDFLKNIDFKSAPSLFHWKYSDTLLKFFCLTGMLISLLFVFGFLSQAPILVHMGCWLLLYVFYLSIVNVGQEFYGFGWETMLLEAGFFAAFMGPSWVTPSWIPILILRWMLFRTEMGAGLIKMRGDPCWKDLTCLYYHHETQPLPNPLSRFFHHSPLWVHRYGVIFSHFCQLVAPIGLFFPQPVSAIAGGFLIFHQLILIISGNYSWLNWLTLVLGVLAFHDFGWSAGLPTIDPPLWFSTIQCAVGMLTLYLSYRPLLNLFSKNQYMNYCWNRWHLVGAYGAFGSVTKERYEIVIEGSDANRSEWKEYGFKGKPGDLNRTPPVVAPYHLRLDWMIWFLPFRVVVQEGGILVRGHSMWFIRFMLRLLENEPSVVKLLKVNPFQGTPPIYLRAKFYRYQFTNPGEAGVWKRTYLGEYFPELSLRELQAKNV